MSQSLSVTLKVQGQGEQQHELYVARMSGREAISSLFAFELEVVRPAGEPLPEDVTAGRLASLVFSVDGKAVRSIHGMLESVALRFAAGQGDNRVYRVKLAPRAGRTRLVTTQQIFMDLSVPDTINKKLELVGLKGDDVRMSLLGDYPVREFIVQYRESDLQLLSRMAEHLGVAFHFQHHEGVDQIVFSDHNDGFYKDPELPSIALTDRLDEPGRVYELEKNTRMIPALYVIYDYNYRKPDQSLIAREKMHGGYGGGVVEYGSHIKTADDGKRLAAIRAEELRCRELDYSGESSIVRLSAGMLTDLEGSEDLEGSLLITAVEHRGEPSGPGGGMVYSNSFSALAADRTFRPERVTPKPTIGGFVTGVVQGADGNTDSKNADIDEHGRYTVQFHFDSALGKLNNKASRPVRMAQPFAGASEGMHLPLKPGTEVALAFVDGDPDRPVIIGALPNHVRPSVVTSQNANVNKLSTDTGITIQFGRIGSS